jgi:hypothetical protein
MYTIFQVLNGSSIMSIGHQPMEHDWSTVAEFSHHVYPMDIKLISAKPLSVAGYLGLTLPFPGQLWLAVIVILLTSMIVGSLLVYRGDDSGNNAVGSALAVLGIFLSQGN